MLFRKRVPTSENLVKHATVKRILVIKWSAMGDVALASAAIEDIRIAFPEAEIDLNTLPPWHQLYQSDPRFTYVHSYPLRAKELRERFGASINWLKTVAARRYDLVIDLQTTDRSRLMIGLLPLFGGGVRYRAGNKPAWPYNLAPQYTGGARHALDLARDTMGAAGIEGATKVPILHYDAQERAEADALMVARTLEKNNFAVLLPGSQAGGWLKRWGAKNYADCARRLLSSHVKQVVIIGGPDETEECENIRRLAGDTRVLNLCGQTKPMHIPLICSQAKCIVGNDTGTAHLAAAALRPMVVICGPTDPRRVRPAGDHVITVQLDIPCKNCYAKTCAHHSCMNLLKADTVIDALSPQLDGA